MCRFPEEEAEALTSRGGEGSKMSGKEGEEEPNDLFPRFKNAFKLQVTTLFVP